MGRYFGKMRVDKPVTRNNYFFQIVRDGELEERERGDTSMWDVDPEELAWSDTTNGREDGFDQVRKGPGNGSGSGNERAIGGRRGGPDWDSESDGGDGPAPLLMGMGQQRGLALGLAVGAGHEGETGRQRKENYEPQATERIENVRFRTERQSLRRLGVSGGIVFTIRTYVARVVDIVEEGEDMAGRMKSAIESWPEDVARLVISC